MQQIYGWQESFSGSLKIKTILVGNKKWQRNILKKHEGGKRTQIVMLGYQLSSIWTVVDLDGRGKCEVLKNRPFLRTSLMDDP